MFSTKKVLIAILTAFTSFILIYSSYLFTSMNKNFTVPEITNKEAGTYTFDITNGIVTESDTGNIFYTQVDNFSSVISTDSSIQPGLNIQASEGNSYLVNIGSSQSTYTINGTGYTFSIDKPGNVLISEQEGKTMILSLNTELQVDLISTVDSSIANTIILYPHEFFIFKPTLNSRIVNVDISRVQQIFTLGYIESRLSKNNSIEDVFIAQIPQINENQQKQIKDISTLYINEQQDKKIALENFLSQNFIGIPGEDLINEYFFLFLNPEKKKTYYQNKILNRFANILKQEIYTTDVQSVTNDLKILQGLGEHESSMMKKILQEDITNYLLTNTKKQTKKLDLYKLYYYLSGSEQQIPEKEDLALYDSFIEYDLYYSKDIYAVINKYTDNLKRISVEDPKTGYAIYYLNKVLISAFKKLDNGETNQIEDILGIFDTYTKMSTGYYTANHIETPNLKGKIRQTGIKEYGLLIDKLGSAFRTNFFRKELNENNLLVRNSNPGLSGKTINIFQSNLDAIYSFFGKYNSTLNNSSINILNKKRFSTGKKYFEMYLAALKDYNKYVNENDKKNEIFIIDSSNSYEAKELDPNYVKRLFSKFNGVNVSRANISSKNISYCLDPRSETNEGEAYCYLVEGAIIGNRFFRFILLPNEDNKITYIAYRDYNKVFHEVPSEIRLDEVKKQYKSTNKDGYNNFLKQAFSRFKGNQSNTNININDENKDIFTDTSSENGVNYQKEELLRTVKNTLLLGENGTFNMVKDFLDIQYKDINIQETKRASDQKAQYDIYISDADLNFNSEITDISGIFESKYSFTAGKQSSFRSPKIKLSESVGNSYMEEYTYEIIGVIPIAQLKKHLIAITQVKKDIEEIINLVNKKIEANRLNIKYYVSNQTFAITYGELNISLNAQSKLIKSLRYKGKNYLTKIIKISNLETYLDQLP